eukprot:scaffold54446_cov17-Prasinocladus_malaysianus.AAC.2
MLKQESFRSLCAAPAFINGEKSPTPTMEFALWRVYLFTTHICAAAPSEGREARVFVAAATSLYPGD